MLVWAEVALGCLLGIASAFTDTGLHSKSSPHVTDICRSASRKGLATRRASLHPLKCSTH